MRNKYYFSSIIIERKNGFTLLKNLSYFFFVMLAFVGVWSLFNGHLALLFSLFYIMCD